MLYFVGASEIFFRENCLRIIALQAIPPRVIAPRIITHRKTDLEERLPQVISPPPQTTVSQIPEPFPLR